MVTASTFSGNWASGKQNSQGGGIDNEGKLTVTQSTFSNNSASSGSSGQGGGIDNEGKFTVSNSILQDNTAISSSDTSLGGGIYNFKTGTVTLSNSRLSGNSVQITRAYGQRRGSDNDCN